MPRFPYLSCRHLKLSEPHSWFPRLPYSEPAPPLQDVVRANSCVASYGPLMGWCRQGLCKENISKVTQL